MKKNLRIAATLAWLSGAVFLHAETIVFDDFSDGDRTNDPAWFISQGAFNVSFGEANNNNSSANQFFTTSFSPTSLADQQGLRVTLSYRPEGANLSTVRVGLFDGVPPTADGWDQWSPGNLTRDWRGYLASIAVDGSNVTEIRRNDNDTDNHAFFGGTTIGAAGTTISTAGTTVFRWIRFEMYRLQDEMVLEVFEGPTPDEVVSLGKVTDDDAPFFDGINNLAFYQTTSEGNGHIRYDNITLETFSTESTVEQPVLSILRTGTGEALVTLSNLTVGLTYEVRSGPVMDLDSFTVVDSFTATNTVESVTLPGTEEIELIWSIVPQP